MAYLPDSPYRPERIRALLAGCLSDSPAESLTQIECDRLWDYLATEACTSKLSGTLLHVLDELKVQPPAPVRMQLQAWSESIAEANAYRVERTAEPLRQLQRENIPFLLLKGAALNAMLYPNPAMRNMVDVDVLIRPEDAERADRALKHAGCRPGPDLVQDDFYPRFYYEREYFTPHLPAVKIDLHVQPFRPLRYSRTVPAGAMWDSPMTVSHGSLQVQVPNPTNLLIHLATHAACHGSPELRWLYDIKLLLERYGPRIDTALLVCKCRRWRINLAVRNALRDMQQHLGPNRSLAPVLRTLRRGTGWADILALYQSPRDASHPVAHVLVDVLTTPGLAFKLSYLKAVLLPGTSHLGQIYRRRHPGWTLVAHLLRAFHGLLRPWLPTQPA